MRSSEDSASDRSPETQLLSQICAAELGELSISGAAVSVMSVRGDRGVAFATNSVAAEIEDVQFALGEGPGVDAFDSGRAVLVPDLDDPTVPVRWPAFTKTVQALQVRAIFSLPLQLGAVTLGVHTLCRRSPGPLDGAGLAFAVRQADVIALALLDRLERPGHAHDLEGLTVEASGFFRSEVYQAAGMVMVQLGVSIEDAMVRLRAHAFSVDRPIDTVAREVVRRELRLEGDNEI